LAPGKNPTDESETTDETVLDEGCFYLTRQGMTPQEVAVRFEISESQVAKRAGRFEKMLKEGKVPEESVSTEFWKSIREEAEGNVKVTFVSEKGFHHSWRSDLSKLDGPTLLSLFESCKSFLDMDPSSRFLEYKTPKNYDPLAMQREISKAVVVIGGLLDDKWKAEQKEGKKKAPQADH
jgi:hypothetical protein